MQLPVMHKFAWLVRAALVQVHGRSFAAHVELAIAVDKHVSCVLDVQHADTV